MSPEFDTVFINANLATLDPKIATPYGAIKDGALAVKAGRIAWLGQQSNLPAYRAKEEIDCRQHWITPGLVDCHTHLVFAGNRAKEFEMRLHGASYEDIARSGGGIVSTVKATRAASHDRLRDESAGRIQEMCALGVTTLEIKSGYGLDLETEMKMLKVARALGDTFDVRIQTTFLGAHAVPPEYQGRKEAYIDLVCNDMIPEIARLGLADAVDGFCENIAFSPAQIRRVFAAAKKYGLPVKLHAEQLSSQGGTKLAAEFGALSADHLEYVDEEGIRAMAKAGTVAVLLPGALYFLGETQKPPLKLFRKYGVPMAVASDCNPGSSPLTAPGLVMNMACTLFGLTPEEALAGMTREGARALGLGDEIGTLEIGKRADLAIWDIGHPAELSYWMGQNTRPERVFGGQM